jgi:tetratricopeptide (TPR) repeat protein
MLKPQKKVSRREIKEDKLVTTYFETRKWVEENKRIVGYIIATPLIIVALGFWWHQKTNEWNDQATTMVAKIFHYYDEGRYEMAINGVPQEGTQGLQAIVDEHGSTKTGQLVKLYLANAYFALKNFDKALEYYEAISVSDKMVTATAYTGMAACYEVQGDHSKAAAYFEKAAAKNMTLGQAPENLQRSAMNYAVAGKKEKAVELLQTLKKEFPTSVVARDVDRLIAEYSS